MIRGLGHDSARGVDLYQCDECSEMYGKLPGSIAITKCVRCEERNRTKLLKERIHAAQKAALTLATAIYNHKKDVPLGKESEADVALWKSLDEVDVPNDSPSGIIAVIEPADDG